MNPLFTAHIVADFLLQPTWLVRLKEKKYIGIVIHAIVHAAVMMLFLIPRNLIALLCILGIAISHGLIDVGKIYHQKKNNAFGPGFLLDQLAHFAILAGATFILPASPNIWGTQTGFGMLMLLFFFSYSLALFNLREPSSAAVRAKLKRTFLITLVFLLFLIPPLLLASSACFGL